MAIQFRPAVEADYEAICALVKTPEDAFLMNPNGRFPLTVEQLRQIATVRQDLTVAVQGDRIVGFANVYNYVAGKVASIGNVVVDPTCRGQGLGRQILEYMIQLVRSQYALPTVTLDVFSHNIPALLLYESLGFKPYDLEVRSDLSGRKVVMIHMSLHQPESPT